MYVLTRTIYVTQMSNSNALLFCKLHILSDLKQMKCYVLNSWRICGFMSINGRSCLEYFYSKSVKCGGNKMEVFKLYFYKIE